MQLEIKAFKEGCPTAFNKVYSHFRLPILNYIRHRVRDGEESQEIAQEVFLKAFRFRERYHEGFALATWLKAIARNTVFDHLRKRKAAAESDDWAMIEGILSIEEIPSLDPHAEEILSEAAGRRSLFKMLRSLSKLQRRVIWLRVVRQLSYQEIANRLGLSLAAVKNLLYRARLTLSAQALQPA